MKEQSASGILATTIEKVKQLIDVSTIIGQPTVLADDLTVIPVSKVTYGFASGGADFPSKGSSELFGGGGGAGVTITPVAFLVVRGGDVSVKYIHTAENAAERVVNMMPDMFDKVSGIVDKVKGNPKQAQVIEDAVEEQKKAAGAAEVSAAE
ncbi:MAG: sporulation protein YtfJ [Clostridia bacterium]|nr:sporulation protein YtfJ [Clostridia bacterium]